jgi:CDP-glycerol glycerophosphotransferase
LKAILKRAYAKKRRGQLCISTWHGTPLKRIALDEPNREGEDFCSNSDYIVAGCALTEHALKSGFRNVIPVKMYGTPRNDALFSDCDTSALKKRLGLPEGKKCILFAPTFRNNVENSGVNQMSEFDFDALMKALQERFGSEWCFVFRVHNMVLKKIDVKSIVETYGTSVIINGNLHDDMAEYLLCADALITDYSGAMFDYALTGRPCFLYVPDRENYEKRERGFYLDFDGLPFPKSNSFAEFLNHIQLFDQDAYRNNLQSFLKQIGNIEDGYASTRILKDILSFMRKENSR